MKTIKNAQFSVKDGKVMMVADIADDQINTMFVQKVSCDYVNPINIQHRYRLTLSSEAAFVESSRKRCFCPNDILVQLACAIEPEISFPPIFRQSNSDFKAIVTSELPVTFKWQQSENPFPIASKEHTPPPPAKWDDVDGQVSSDFDASKAVSGKWLRCMASNAAGSAISKPFKVK
jgi:hypothetical protein